MKIALIAALAKNRTIGRDNKLPWHLPEDLAHFKRVTMGKPIIMGRKTFESIGRPLPGRINIVVTRQKNFRADAVRVVHSLDEALELARKAKLEGTDAPADEVIIIGGEQLYRRALPFADRLYLTRVADEVPGDAFFPPIDPDEWREVARSEPSAVGSPAYSFHILERR